MSSPSAPIKILIADAEGVLQDSAKALFEDGRIEAAHRTGCRLDQVVRQLDQTPADLVVLDIGVMWEEGYRCIEELMAAHPTPVLVLHRSRDGAGTPEPARGRGALELLEVDGWPSAEFWRQLIPKLLLLSQVRVVRHVKGARKKAAAPSPPPASPMVVIASSLGGPKALAVLLKALPQDFPAPICICQHISDGFTEGLARWLDTETGLSVREATEGERPTSGVRVAPSGAHLVFRPDGSLALDPGPARHGFRPSCDALLLSAAEAFGASAIGVVLTGLGKDGAQGLLEIRRRGGRTVAQDRATSVAFGMPGEAIALGAAERVEPLEKIAPLLTSWVRGC